MKYFLLFLICLSAEAASFKLENGEIRPFTRVNYPLKELIRDYAHLMKLNVTFSSNLIKDSETVHMELNSKVTLPEFKKVFYELLGSSGYSPIEEKNILWLVDARDMRYMPSSVYTDESYPKDASFSMVLYKLKFPLSSEIARNLRPFMSRFGRVIDLSDARTIIVHDQGDNVERLIGTIKSMDTEAAYKGFLKNKPDFPSLPAPDKNSPPMPVQGAH